MTASICARAAAGDPKAVTIEVQGALAEADHAALHQALNEQVRKGVLRFVLDLSAVPVRSTGDFPASIAGLLGSLGCALSDRGGGLAIVGASPQLRQILGALRFDRLLHVCASEADAVKAIAGGAQPPPKKGPADAMAPVQVKLAPGAPAKSAEAERLLNRGIEKAENEDFEGAIADFDAALKLDPRSESILFNRALAKDFLEDHEGAFADYDQALRLAPDAFECLYGRARMSIELGKPLQARADFQKALKLAPPDWENADDAREALRQLGRRE